MAQMPISQFRLDWGMFDRTEFTVTRPNAAIGESRIDMSRRRWRSNLAPPLEEELNLQIQIQQLYWQSMRAQFRAIAERLCLEHPDISTDPGIYGGNPHIKNVRLTVGNILGKLQNYGTIEAVAEIYAPYVTESQIKEAIAYAQDFLEEAIHAGEPS